MMLIVAALRGLECVKGTCEVPATKRVPCSLPSLSQIRQSVVTCLFCMGPAGYLGFSGVEDGHIVVGHLLCEAPGSH